VRRPQRHLVLLAASYDEMALRHPRFTAWRRLWAHAVAPWQAPPDVESRLPTLLFDDGAVMIRVFDPVQWRGRVSLDAQAARPYRDEIDAVLQRSEPAFPAMRLGL
jgi:hypothetical protein